MSCGNTSRQQESSHVVRYLLMKEPPIPLALGTAWLLQKMRGSTLATRQPRNNRVPAHEPSMWKSLVQLSMSYMYSGL
jgi:hypothetical protein